MVRRRSLEPVSEVRTLPPQPFALLDGCPAGRHQLPDRRRYLAGKARQLRSIGGGEYEAVEAMHRRGTLRIRTDLTDTHVIVRFVDTGGGMSAGNLSRVFEPYFTTKTSGSGLGLLIVRRIVREHGGELSIESSQGKGLTLTIRLPFIDKRIRMLEAGEARDNRPED